MLRRRTLLKAAFGAAAFGGVCPRCVHSTDGAAVPAGVSLRSSLPGEDIFAYLRRTTGGFDAARYKQILGAANPFKEGDRIVGVAAADDAPRATARALLAATRVEAIEGHPLLEDRLSRLLVQGGLVAPSSEEECVPAERGHTHRFSPDDVQGLSGSCICGACWTHTDGWWREDAKRVWHRERLAADAGASPSGVND